MRAVPAIMLVGMTLVGCDTRECVDWDTENRWVATVKTKPNGGTTVVQEWKPVTFCAEYAPDPSPSK